MLADVILLVRLIVFHGINPVEPLFPLEWEDHAETQNGSWIGSTLNYTKAVIKEQVESFMVAAVINYQSAKVWWYESSWESVLADLGGFLVILGLGLLLYMYIMAITSVVVLRMVETDILY